jgi:hypothetical protein
VLAGDPVLGKPLNEYADEPTAPGTFMITVPFVPTNTDVAIVPKKLKLKPIGIPAKYPSSKSADGLVTPEGKVCVTPFKIRLVAVTPAGGMLSVAIGGIQLAEKLPALKPEPNTEVSPSQMLEGVADMAGLGNG